MKAARLILTSILLIAAFNSFAQVKARKTQRPVLHSIKLGYPGLAYSLENMLALQTSFGLAYSLETRLAPQTTLNTELALEGLDLIPALRLEPRYYYSLKNRQRKGRNTSNFAAEYIAVSAGFYSGDLRNETFLDEPLFISFFPKWGLRRALGQHFIAEIAAGYALHIGRETSGLSGAFDFELRIGYVF